jgi:hypothetical protein
VILHPEPLFNKLSEPGGADRDRTDDLRLAKPALSQLSYSPGRSDVSAVFLVGLGRVELPTSPLSGVRSNQLSYRPKQQHGNSAAGLHTSFPVPVFQN